MERALKDISLSEDMKHALRMARIIEARKEQERLFRRNAMIRQKIAGVIISLVSIGIVWFLSQNYGQTEYAIFLPIILCVSFYLILTDRAVMEEC